MLKKSFALQSLSSLKEVGFIQVVLASCFIAICAQIKVPLYFTPVPFTTQGIGVMLVGALLGSKKGALAVLFYLIQGALGLPVWAGGKSGGLLYLLGPTGGYLMAYPLQAYLSGFASSHLLKTITLLLLSVLLHLSCGSLWLAQFVGIENCFMLGLFPFVLGDATKACLVTLYIKCCFRGKNNL